MFLDRKFLLPVIELPNYFRQFDILAGEKECVKMMISNFEGKSTPKGSYSAKTGVNCPMSPLENKRPMGLDALLVNQLGHLPKFQKLHIYSIFASGVEIELIFTL